MNGTAVLCQHLTHKHNKSHYGFFFTSRSPPTWLPESYSGHVLPFSLHFSFSTTLTAWELQWPRLAFFTSLLILHHPDCLRVTVATSCLFHFSFSTNLTAWELQWPRLAFFTSHSPPTWLPESYSGHVLPFSLHFSTTLTAWELQWPHLAFSLHITLSSCST